MSLLTPLLCRACSTALPRDIAFPEETWARYCPECGFPCGSTKTPYFTAITADLRMLCFRTEGEVANARRFGLLDAEDTLILPGGTDTRVGELASSGRPSRPVDTPTPAGSSLDDALETMTGRPSQPVSSLPTRQKRLASFQSLLERGGLIPRSTPPSSGQYPRDDDVLALRNDLKACLKAPRMPTGIGGPLVTAGTRKKASGDT